MAKHAPKQGRGAAGRIIPLAFVGVGLFVAAVLFFLFRNGMLHFTPPILRPAEKYVEADSAYAALRARASGEQIPRSAGSDLVRAAEALREAASSSLDEGGSGISFTESPASMNAPEANAEPSFDATGSAAGAEEIASDLPGDSLGLTGGDQGGDGLAPPDSNGAGPEGGVIGISDYPTVMLQPERLKRLVRVYEKMRPRQAALIIGTMPDQQATEILLDMKEQSAAKVLAALDPEKAARLSQLLVRD